MRTSPLLVLCVAAAGCGATDFDISQPIAEQRAQGSPLPGPLALLFPLPLNIDLSSEIEAMATGPIDSVTLARLTLKITATAKEGGNDTDDWRFVDSIRVFVKSSKSGSQLPRIEIANVSSPGQVQSFDFNIVGGIDINPYINEGSIVEAESSGRVPEDDVTYDGTGVFTVHLL